MHIFYAIPFLVMAALVVALGPGLKSIVIALIILNWPTYTRVIRSEILHEIADYVHVARQAVPPICGSHETYHSELYLFSHHRSINVNRYYSLNAVVFPFRFGSGTGYADWGTDGFHLQELDRRTAW